MFGCTSNQDPHTRRATHRGSWCRVQPAMGRKRLAAIVDDRTGTKPAHTDVGWIGLGAGQGFSEEVTGRT